MIRKFFIADTHFGHRNALNFRPQFTSIEDHDEFIIDRWNAVVRPQDKVYHLGDVCMNRRCIPTIARCNGQKVLVKGNHDLFKLSDWTPYFEDICGLRVFSSEGFVCSHVPLHPEPLKRWGVNVHGHLHSEHIPDPNYLCVSAEQVEYQPVELDDLLSMIEKNKEIYD